MNQNDDNVVRRTSNSLGNSLSSSGGGNILPIWMQRAPDWRGGASAAPQQQQQQLGGGLESGSVDGNGSDSVSGGGMSGDSNLMLATGGHVLLQQAQALPLATPLPSIASLLSVTPASNTPVPVPSAVSIPPLAVLPNKFGGENSD